MRLNPCYGLAVLTLALNVPTSVAAHPATPTPAASSAPSPVGDVAFANSGNAAAQRDFQYGVAQLHNFQYPDAAAAFKRAQALDPGFALAYWGEAMTYNHTVWMQQDAGKARAALARLGPDRAARLAHAKTPREQAYLDAVETLYSEGSKFERDRRYAQAMARLHERWPDDVDATAFYALALLGTAHDGRDVPTYMRAYALLEDLFRSHPRHPGVAHYLIHSVDDAAHAPLGLKAARAYGGIAPESSHALHMTSHIYLALGLWDDVVAANEAAIDLGVRRAKAAGRSPAGCGHGHTWLNYAYLQQGRFADSRRMLQACLQEVKERPHHEDTEDQFDADESSLGSYYSMWLRYLLDGPTDAGEVAAWQPAPDAVPLAVFMRDYGRALLAAKRGQLPQLQAAAAATRASAQALSAAMDRFGLTPGNPARRITTLQVDQINALLAAQSPTPQLAPLEAVAAVEDGLPAAFGPPQVDQPTRELLGAALLKAGRAAPAREQFEKALVLNPGRVGPRRGLLQAAQALGDTAEAAAIEASLRATLKRADSAP